MSTANTLRLHLDEWIGIEAPPTVLRWIQHGVRLPLVKEPIRFHLANRLLTVRQKKFVDQEIKLLLASGAISQSIDVPHCVSPVGCVPKKNNDFRLIVDLRDLNCYCRSPSFVAENIETVCNLMSDGDDLYTVDLKNGFHHLSVDVEHRKYLGIYWKNTYYTWNVLPFGLSASPYFFQKCLRPVVEYLRSQGLKLVFYVDDCILMVEEALSSKHLAVLLDTLARLGWIINEDKSHLTPSKSVEYIGYIVCTAGPGGRPWLKIPQRRIRKLRYALKRAIEKRLIPARRLAGIAGQCIAMTKVLIPGKLLLRNVYKVLRQKSSWQDNLLLTDEAVKDLRWWEKALSAWNGCPITPKTIDVQITTDASSSGWGAFMGDSKAAGFWNHRVSRQSSNYRELLTILLAVQSFRAQLRGKRVQVLSDNITAIAYVNHLGGTSTDLTSLAKAIWAEAYINQIHLVCNHIAGVKNVVADALSRLSPIYEWRLHPGMFRVLEDHWGPHTIDRFASLTTTQLQRYNSRYWDPLCSGVDALAQQNWASENNFVNPPFRLIQQVLDIVETQRCSITLIAPLWRAQPWFNRLLRLSIAPPIPIPMNKAAMWLMTPVPEPLRNRRWKIYAWRLSGQTI